MRRPEGPDLLRAVYEIRYALEGDSDALRLTDLPAAVRALRIERDRYRALLIRAVHPPRSEACVDSLIGEIRRALS